MHRRNLGVMGGTLLSIVTMGPGPAVAQVQVNQTPPQQPAPPANTQIVNNAPGTPVAQPPVVVERPQPQHSVVVAGSPTPVVVSGPIGSESRYAYRTGRGLLAGGATLFGVTYLATIIGAAVASDICQADSTLGCREAAWPIYIPVIGPFVQMGYVSGNGANTARALLAIDGTLQAGGLAMAIVGTVMAVSNHPGHGPRVAITPAALGSGSGLVAAGRF